MAKQQPQGDHMKKTAIITGASRGIGREIALRAARDGANIVIAAKSAEPHPKLPGTIYSVAQEVEAAGGRALALQVDVRDETNVREALALDAEHFGGIDGLINNAGAIKLTGVQHIELKRFDLMHQINTRAVLLCSQAALAYLKKSGGHILNLSPPLNLSTKWFAQYSPYTVTKYGMSMLTLGMSEEFKAHGISVNSLWPQTMIATAAIEFQLGSREAFKYARTPAIMADAAHTILTSNDRRITGRLLIDEEILRETGVTEFEHYRFALDTTDNLMSDLFVD